MKKVLLTGASGFVGRQAFPHLAELGYEIHASLHPSEPEPDVDGDIAWHRADLLDASDVAALVEAVKPTHLLHFAWYVEPGQFFTSPLNLRWVQASIDLMQEFARHDGKRVVMAGTCAEYDWQHDVCLEDETPLRPATLYGATKLALQTVLSSFADQVGFSAAWGRIFYMYGPHERPERLVSSVVLSLLRGEPVKCSHGEQVRDFMHVADVAGAFVALLDGDVTGAVNIATGHAAPLKEIIFTLADHVGRRDLIQLGALPARPDDPPVLTADVTRLRDEVGWQPHYTLKQGLIDTVEWWKAHMEGAAT